MRDCVVLCSPVTGALLACCLSGSHLCIRIYTILPSIAETSYHYSLCSLLSYLSFSKRVMSTSMSCSAIIFVTSGFAGCRFSCKLPTPSKESYSLNTASDMSKTGVQHNDLLPLMNTFKCSSDQRVHISCFVAHPSQKLVLMSLQFRRIPRSLNLPFRLCRQESFSIDSHVS